MKVNQVTPAVVEAWKQEYPSVRRIVLAGQEFYYRPISRQEYRQLMSRVASGELQFQDMEDAMVEICLLSPDWKLADFDALPAGVLFTLGRKVREASGFVDTEPHEEVVYDALPDVRVSDEIVEQFKAGQNYLVRLTLGRMQVLLRPITRAEWNRVRAPDRMTDSNYDVEIEVCRYGLLYPTLDQLGQMGVPGGYVTQISNAILQASGFNEQPEVEEIL